MKKEEDDEVARLVRLAGPTGPTGSTGQIAAERLARVRTAVHGAWRDEYVVRSRRRWRTVGVLLAAAASVVVAFAIRGLIRTPAPVVVAHIDHFTGQATGSRVPFTAGGAVMSGSTVTTSAGTLAMTLTSGVHLRLDASSTVRMDAATDVALERGAVYVDSAGAHPIRPRASPLSIHTPAGLVRDIGTRFEVRLAGAGVRIRVRDGQVHVTYANGVDARAGAGWELFSRPDGSDRSINRRSIDVTGSEWEWAERAGPTFSVEGKTLGAFLDWVSREGAWTVTFSNRRLSEAARATVLSGRPDLLKGLTPAEALAVVLPTCGLRHSIDGQKVVIAREIR
jgi:ferric-dicitrate binding protein FerR (iron transport regulator)